MDGLRNARGTGHESGVPLIAAELGGMTAARVLAAIYFFCEMYEAETAADAPITARERDRVTGEDTNFGLRSKPKGWIGREHPLLTAKMEQDRAGAATPPPPRRRTVSTARRGRGADSHCRSHNSPRRLNCSKSWPGVGMRGRARGLRLRRIQPAVTRAR